MNEQSSFVESVLAELGDIAAFEPMAEYNPDGDCIEFLVSNEPYYAKILDGWVTVYYGEKSGDVVGAQIKGVVHNLMRQFPGVRIDIEGAEVRLACLLRGPAYEAGDAEKQRTYKAVIEKAENKDVRAFLEYV